MEPGLINTIVGIIAGVITIITGILTIKNAVKKSPMSKSPTPVPLKGRKPTTHTPPIGSPSLVAGGGQEFTNSDTDYRDWLTANPEGFVVNTPRSMPSNNMALHKAVCSHVRNFDARPEGAFTERDYVKICANDIDILREWAKGHGRPDGSFTVECSVCKPTKMLE